LALELLGRLYLEHGDAAAAEPPARAALELLQQTLGAAHRRTALAARDLASCLTARGRFEEAEPLLLESYSQIKAAFGDRRRETVQTLTALVHLYDGWEKPAEADRYRAELPLEAPAGPLPQP